GRPLAPQGENWEKAVAYWQSLPSDEGATYDKEVTLKASEIIPQVTWGTSPQDVLPITESVPDPDEFGDFNRQQAVKRALEYMGLT
ncbi:aconitase family protein, partial [Planococcus sp. SIMBA_160]